MDVEDLYRAADVLQRLLAAVDEGVFDAQLDQVRHDLAQTLQALREFRSKPLDEQKSV